MKNNTIKPLDFFKRLYILLEFPILETFFRKESYKKLLFIDLKTRQQKHQMLVDFLPVPNVLH